jgi:hypothetical protein
MTGADDVFKDVKSVFSPNKEIYGTDDDSFLDVFNEPISVNTYSQSAKKTVDRSNDTEEEAFAYEKDKRLWN